MVPDKEINNNLACYIPLHVINHPQTHLDLQTSLNDHLNTDPAMAKFQWVPHAAFKRFCCVTWVAVATNQKARS